MSECATRPPIGIIFEIIQGEPVMARKQFRFTIPGFILEGFTLKMIASSADQSAKFGVVCVNLPIYRSESLRVASGSPIEPERENMAFDLSICHPNH